MATLSKSPLRRLAGVILFLLISAFLTFTGFYLSLRQIHSPDWTRNLAIILLLPYAAVNRIFHWVTGPEALQTHVYYVAFFIGTLAQLFYYFLIFTLLKRLLAFLRQSPRSPARKEERP